MYYVQEEIKMIENEIYIPEAILSMYKQIKSKLPITIKSPIKDHLKILKGVTSRLLRQEFPELKKILGGEHFWSPSYCLITTGQVTLDKLKKYVESQGKNESI